jgi:uncharacterized protein (DUF2384 family)
MIKIELYRYGLEVFNFDKDKFKRWMNKEHPTLGNKTPYQCVKRNHIGIVLHLLDKIEYNNY